MPSHSHSFRIRDSNNTDSNKGISYGENTSGTGSVNNTGGSSSHTHSLSGTATIALNVKYTDVIVCSKD